MAPAFTILTAANAPSTKPGTELLQTARLVLRRFVASDAAALARAADYKEVANDLRDGFPSPYTLADAEWYLSGPAAASDSTYPEQVGIFAKSIGADGSLDLSFIGGIGIIPKTNVYYRTWELGYWLTPPSWGNGYATEVVQAFTTWCFSTWPQLNRIEAEVYQHNGRSSKVLEKAGFLKEGVKRGVAEKNGVLCDEMLYAITRDDIAAVDSADI